MTRRSLLTMVGCGKRMQHRCWRRCRWIGEPPMRRKPSLISRETCRSGYFSAVQCRLNPSGRQTLRIQTACCDPLDKSPPHRRERSARMVAKVRGPNPSDEIAAPCRAAEATPHSHCWKRMAVQQTIATHRRGCGPTRRTSHRPRARPVPLPEERGAWRG